jgi:hypothetical protein
MIERDDAVRAESVTARQQHLLGRTFRVRTISSPR